MRKLIISGLFLLLNIGSAFAQTLEYRGGYDDAPWVPSAQQACEGALAWRNAHKPDPSAKYTLEGVITIGPMHGDCQLKRCNSNDPPFCTIYGNEISWIARPKKCADGSDPPTSGKCPEHCADNAGTISTMNVTRGWARSSLANKADQLGTTNVVPSSICSGLCKYSVLGNEEAYRSQTPSAQGLYRLSSDVTVIQTDQSCTPGDADKVADPSTPDMPCPGQLGQLNGKPYCAITPGDNGVEPNGAPGTGKSTDDKGNPAAGEKPKTGEGSGTGGVGRTPTEGNGGNAGGPGGAAAGGTGTKPGGKEPDGTTDKPDEGKEQEACGAPGQKPCKIDETGTPTGYGKFDKLNGDVDAAKTSWVTEITGIKDMQWSDWTWTFQLPSGCTALDLSYLGVNMDVCRWQPVIHDIMSMVWAISTVMGCVYLVFRAQGGH